jgi:beta-lactamase class A
VAGTTDAPSPFARVEADVGGRVGVFAIDTGTGRSLGHREDERFAMCSTFKWVLAAALLARVDRGEARLGERVPYGPADLVEYAPITSAHLSEGAMTVDALCEAAVTRSDNVAANLLLARVGGPAGLTAFVRRAADEMTRFDRSEPSLNENLPGDPRDTTTPRAMATLMRALLCGEVLSLARRDRLIDWMRACETGRERLRAGLPAGWVVGDKTGTGSRGAVNDVAIAVPPARAPILIAAYLSDGTSPSAVAAAAHAEIARIVAKHLG